MKPKLFEVLPFDSPEFKQAWEDWKEHRKALKAPLTDVASKRQLNFLATLQEAEAIRSIDNSINFNWVGLFAPRAINELHTPTKPQQIGLWDGKKYGQ